MGVTEFPPPSGGVESGVLVLNVGGRLEFLDDLDPMGKNRGEDKGDPGIGDGTLAEENGCPGRVFVSPRARGG